MSNALTLHEGNNNEFAVIASPEGESIFAEILDVGVQAHEFPTFKVPAGGGTTWEGEMSDGPVDSKSLEVVIAWAKTAQRTFHSVSFEDAEEGAPPDCVSEDGVNGYGAIVEGGERCIRTCEGCPNNEWGSGKKKGKACSEKAELLCFTPEEILPIIVRVPPTSLKPFRAFAIKQMSKQRGYSGVVTRLTLKKVAGSPAYSVIEFGFVEKLSKEQDERVKRLAEVMKARFPGRTAEALAGMDDDNPAPRTVDAEPEEAVDWTDADK